MTNELGWWDWLTMTPTALRFRGVDETHRFRETGHTQPLAPRWARTVGMWRLETSAAIAETAGVTLNAVRVFKHRHGLLSIEGVSAHRSRVELAETAGRSVDVVLPRHGYGRAQQCVSEEYGILPIEAHLYHEGYRRVLNGAKLTPETYSALERALDREALWLEHGGFSAFDEVR